MFDVDVEIVFYLRRAGCEEGTGRPWVHFVLVVHLVCDVVDRVHGHDAQGVDGDPICCSFGLV